MIIEILTLEEVLLSKEAKSVVVPGKGGRFEMLDNHAPIVSLLDAGIIKVTNNKNEVQEIKISFGSVEMSNNKVTILANTE